MLIKEKGADRVFVSDIPTGGVFRSYENYFLKTDIKETNRDGFVVPTCINIDNGRAETFYETDTVTFVHAECVVAP